MTSLHLAHFVCLWLMAERQISRFYDWSSPLKSFLSSDDGLFDRMRESSATGSRCPHLPPVTIAPISVLAIAVLFLEIPCHSLSLPAARNWTEETWIRS